jgi:GTP diphosphokinase / guanosine-3',5'-bis(diphosphate) 3'-diphosphatase
MTANEPKLNLSASLQDAYLSAWQFAAKAHRGQTVPGTDLPYLVHIGAVAMEVLVAHALEPLSDPLLATQCALLHDTVEDCGVAVAELKRRFGPAVAAGVLALSKRKDLPKPEAMSDSLARILAQPREVWAVKLADRISNLQPPPAHWTATKRAAYQQEARVILEALGGGHSTLAARLAQKILGYAAFLAPAEIAPSEAKLPPEGPLA